MKSTLPTYCNLAFQVLKAKKQHNFLKVVKIPLLLLVLITIQLPMELTAQITYTLSSGTSTTTTAGLCPIRTSVQDSRSQYLIRASELTALGAVAGEISSISLFVTDESGRDLNNFTIKMGLTTENVLSTSFLATSSTVYSTSSFNDNDFNDDAWNAFGFSSNFSWDGVSNIVVEFCFDNTQTTSGGAVRIYNPGFVSSSYITASNDSGCSLTGTNTTSSNRPHFQLVINSNPCSDLFISEYVEGSGNNRYLEIYNPTANSVNLSAYSLVLYSGGSNSVSETFDLSGNLAAYATHVVGHSSANIYGGTVHQTQNGDVMGFSGDDAIALRKNGINIDIIGRIGQDPGSAWTGGGCSTQNSTLIRKSAVQTGDPLGNNSFNPSVEWDCASQDDVSNLGQHTSSCLPVCNTPTAGGTLSVNPSSTVVNDIVVLSVTGNGGAVIRYEYSFDNFVTAPQVLASGLNPLDVFTPVNEPQIWFRAVSQDGNCPEGLSNVVLLELECAPVISFGTSDGDYITNVTFNSINNNSTSDAGDDAYQNFTNLNTSVCAGSSYTLSASGTFTFGSDQGFAAWIDWDGDGTFSTTENVLISGPAATASTTVNVPGNAFNGPVKMRVLCAWNQTPTNDACAAFDYQYGEIEEYTIVINAPTASTLTESACEEFTLNNQTYNSSGQYTQTLVNAAGCDSVITLNLTILESTTSTLTETACDEFELNNQTYNSSGQYTQTLVNAAGCDSVITLNLTILESTSSTLTETACNSFTLNNQTYNSSGQYTQTLVNAAGCDSVITLNLTINVATMNLTASSTPATLGFSNGSATVVVSGGVGPFTYQWNDPFEQTTATAWGVFVGNYTCVVTDGNGCTAQVSVYVPLNLAVPLTQVRTQFCNTVDHQLNDVISCNTVTGATNYRWEFKPVGGPALPEYTRGSNNYNLRLSWISGIQLGVTYEVRVKAYKNGQWGNYGPICTITTLNAVPPTQLLAGYSPNDPLTTQPYVMCGSLRAENVELADRYEWELVGPNNILVQSQSYHLALSLIPGIQMNAGYNVRVRARVNGVWGSFAAQLPIQTGAPALTSIWLSHCNTTRALNQSVAAYNVCSATSYTFKFEHATEADRIIVRPTYSTLLSYVNPGLTPGETYSVSVKVMQGGVDGSYSTACDITIAGPQSEMMAGEVLNNKSLEIGAMGVYPNPNNGDEVWVDLSGLSAGYKHLSIVVYDIFGKQIAVDSFGQDGPDMSYLLRFKNELATGLYLIQVNVDGKSYATEKLIVK